jgi:hypothetical protein
MIESNAGELRIVDEFSVRMPTVSVLTLYILFLVLLF